MGKTWEWGRAKAVKPAAEALPARKRRHFQHFLLCAAICKKELGLRRTGKRRPCAGQTCRKFLAFRFAAACNFPAARFISALRPRGQSNEHSAARFFRRSTDRQSSSRQLSWRDHQIRGAAEDALVHLLCRGPACDHRLAGPGGPAQIDARGYGGLYRGRRRSQEAHHLQSKSGERPCGACVDFELRGADGLAQPHDAVQGKGRQGPRKRQHRALRLPGADGGGHPGLPRGRRARGRGPEAASGADARYRAEIQQRFRRSRSPPLVSRTASSRCPNR